MSRDWSLFLDVLRLFAAIIVVHSHFVTGSMIDIESPLEFGREAVVIFFLMSGYVIAYTSEEKHTGWKDYLSARVARITSIAYPALAVGFIIAALGVHFTPAMYSDIYQLNHVWKYIIAHSAFLGETSLMNEKPPLNDPYWSLSYEVWYYIFFAIAFYAKGLLRWVLAIPTLALMGIKIILLMPVWWAGVYLYKTHAQPKQAKYWVWATLSISLVIFLKTFGVDAYLRALIPDSWELGSADRFLWDYVVTILVFCFFYCVRSIDLSVLNQHASGIRKYANYTFALYLTHNIVLKVSERILEHKVASWWQILVVISVIIAFAHFVMKIGDKIKPSINNSTLKLFNGMKS